MIQKVNPRFQVGSLSQNSQTSFSSWRNFGSRETKYQRKKKKTCFFLIFFWGVGVLEIEAEEIGLFVDVMEDICIPCLYIIYIDILILIYLYMKMYDEVAQLKLRKPGNEEKHGNFQ